MPILQLRKQTKSLRREVSLDHGCAHTGRTRATLVNSYPGPRRQGTFRANGELVRLQTTHRNQPNHQRMLGHGSEGQRFPKKHGPFPRSFFSQHGSRERKSRPKRHSQQPEVRQCGGMSAGCSEPCQVPPVSPPQSPHQPYFISRVLLSPWHGQGQRIHVYRGPASLELAFYSLLMSPWVHFLWPSSLQIQLHSQISMDTGIANPAFPAEKIKGCRH